MINKILGFLFILNLFILPIPDTMAVRNITVLLILLLLMYLIKKNTSNIYILQGYVKYVVWLLFALTIYMLCVAYFISTETLWSLKEIKSQWIISLVYFYIFYMFSQYFIGNNKENRLKIYYGVFFVFLMHIIIIDMDAILQYTGVIERSKISGLTDHTDKASYLTNLLLTFIFAEFLYRSRYKKNILPFNNIILFIIFFLTLFSLISETSRNATITALILGSVTFVFFMINSSSKYKIPLSIVLIGLVLMPVLYSIKYDTRWDSFRKTIPYAVDTKTYQYWKMPIEEARIFYMNEKIDSSLYLRLAWFVEGIKAVQHNPYGVGYGRNAFRHSFSDEKIRKNTSHSHSGLLDFAIGLGYIGLSLWVLFMGSLLFITYQKYKKENNFYASILFLLILDFFIRSSVDSNIRDHMLVTFMLLLGLFSSFIVNDVKACKQIK